MSFSLLVVEDEPLERRVLVQQTREIFLDCGEIWEADNGIEALRLAQEKRPDVMLVDLNIPGLAGLRLIEVLRELGFSGGIVITTAYDRFSYLKKAVGLGVEGYLLKPVDEEELEREVRKCLAIRTKDLGSPDGLEPVCSYAETYLVRDLLAGNIPENAIRAAFHWPADGELQARPLMLELPAEAGQAEQDAVVTACRGLLRRDYLSLSAPLGCGAVFLIQPIRRTEEEALQLSCWACAHTLTRRAQREGLPTPTVRAGGLCARYGELRERWAAMDASPPRPCTSPLFPAKERSRLRRRWSQRLWEGNADYLSDMLRRTLGRPGAFWPGAALFLEALELADPDAPIWDVLALFQAEEPFEALKGWLSARRGPDEETGHRAAVVRKGLFILEERYGQDLSEQQLAEELGLSQAYFSRLFKEETGESFVAAQSRIRMEHAKALLLSGTVSVREAARRCGYPNYKYFLRAFKRETGLTTSQFLSSRTQRRGER